MMFVCGIFCKNVVTVAIKLSFPCEALTTIVYRSCEEVSHGPTDHHGAGGATSVISRRNYFIYNLCIDHHI